MAKWEEIMGDDDDFGEIGAELAAGVRARIAFSRTNPLRPSAYSLTAALSRCPHRPQAVWDPAEAVALIAWFASEN